VDGEVPKLEKRQVDRKIRFGSDEYFAFLDRHPAAAAWFSVGPEMEVVVEGELIEIVNQPS